MLRTLVVGLGRAGRFLHLPALRSARAASAGEGLIANEPPVVFDHWADARALPPHEGLAVASLAEARRRLDPARTVVHVCTPAAVRAEVLEDAAQLGFRRLLVEKPLATDAEDLDRVLRLRRECDLELIVVAQWLQSLLTRQIEEVLRSGALGELRALTFVQRKSRYQRTLAHLGRHPTALDIELPHSIGVALRLAGPAAVVEAAWADMAVEGTVVPRMGGARLVLRHEGGVTTEIVSDLTAPLRERSVSLELARGRLVGHYPASLDDSYAQLRVASGGGRGRRSVFADDALAAFFVHSYRAFRDGDDLAPDLELNAQVVGLLSEAKARCESSAPADAGVGAGAAAMVGRAR